MVPSTPEPSLTSGLGNATGPSDPGGGIFQGAGCPPEPAGAGSAASLPVARTTGCDGAISIRAIAQGRWAAGDAISRQVWGAGEVPPGWGLYETPGESPPRSNCIMTSAAQGPHMDGDRAPRHRGAWQMWDGRGTPQGPTPNPRGMRRGMTQLPHPDVSVPCRHGAEARDKQRGRGVLCTPGHPTPPGRGAGNAPRLRSSSKGAASFSLLLVPWQPFPLGLITEPVAASTGLGGSVCSLLPRARAVGWSRWEPTGAGGSLPGPGGESSWSNPGVWPS